MSVKQLTHKTRAHARAPARAQAPSQLWAYIAVIFLGFSILAVAGHAQSPSLHGAAHDTRHATGFPCH